MELLIEGVCFNRLLICIVKHGLEDEESDYKLDILGFPAYRRMKMLFEYIYKNNR